MEWVEGATLHTQHSFTPTGHYTKSITSTINNIVDIYLKFIIFNKYKEYQLKYLQCLFYHNNDISKNQRQWDCTLGFNH